MWLFNTIVTEWPKLQDAPLSVVTIAIVMIATGWAVGRFLFRQRILDLKERISLKDDLIAEYERKLDGKSPDEAQAQITALRDEVAALASYRLSNEAQERLKAALEGTPSKVNIYRDTGAADADRLYRQVISIFRSAGWSVNSHTILGIASPPDSGITLAYWSATDPDATAAIKNALNVAGLDVMELVNPDSLGAETGPTIIFSSRDPDWTATARWAK